MKRTIILSALLCLAVGASAQDWAPAGNNIRTRWAADVEKAVAKEEIPLPEYPRPQMVREDWQNLNGLWNYAVNLGTDEKGNEAWQGKILVPFCPESSLSGLCVSVAPGDELTYERNFNIPRSWKKKNVLLHFGAVDWEAEVTVNGTVVGSHKGGYSAFSFDITNLVKKGKNNTLRVKVKDATDTGYQPRGKQILVPKSIWYTPVTGIWQTVWLEAVSSDAHICSYVSVADVQNGTFNITAKTEGIQAGDKLRVKLLNGMGGKAIATADAAADGTVVIASPDKHLWSPSDPFLYGLELAIVRDGKAIDEVQGYTAMRSVSMVKDNSIFKYKRIGLNGEPLFNFGPLDQGWWPDGLYTAPTDEALKFDVQKTKDFGFNMIRKHIKVEPDRWYYWCDVLGIMVWQDMPCIADHSNQAYRGDLQKNTLNEWSRDSFLKGTECIVPDEWKANYYREWQEIMEQHLNFPCIVVWVPFNEAWGQFDTRKVVEFTRALDPTRLINESSGGNFVLAGDILDGHHYPYPAQNVFEGGMINVIGEYGGIGYPIEGHLWQIGRKWGYGQVESSSEGVMARYSQYADYLKGFAAHGTSGAVYTQTTDVEGEVNGLMTYDREIVKVDEAAIKQINEAVIASMPR